MCDDYRKNKYLDNKIKNPIKNLSTNKHFAKFKLLVLLT